MFVLKHLFCSKLCLWSVVLCLFHTMGGAAPQLLQKDPVRSPDRKFAANVEWDDVGFIGLLRMIITRPDGGPLFSVELPEINPSPANLAWINNDWVACESFLGDKGSAFFYVHIPTRRGYLVEIIAPRPDADWVVNFATNDAVSTAAIHTISRQRSSLFPILLRGLPTEGADYYLTDFCESLRDTVDAYSNFRKRENFRELEFLSAAYYRTSVGAVVLATLDERPHVVYFPIATTAPKEMLSRVKRHPLPTEVEDAFAQIGAPAPRVRWVSDSGEYEIYGTNDDGQSTGPVTRGRFENVQDNDFVPDAEEQIGSPAAAVKISDPDRKPIPAAKGKAPAKKSNTSRSKKPSRSG